MLLALIVLFIFCTVPSSSLQCYSCGVFLNAPTPNCRGEPKPINCTNSRSSAGCVSITAMNRRLIIDGCCRGYIGDDQFDAYSDGSYYVEKRCANADEKDLNDGECIDFQMPKLKEARKCFCTTMLCNSVSTITAIPQLSFTICSITIFTFSLPNKLFT